MLQPTEKYREISTALGLVDQTNIPTHFYLIKRWTKYYKETIHQKLGRDRLERHTQHQEILQEKLDKVPTSDPMGSRKAVKKRTHEMLKRRVISVFATKTTKTTQWPRPEPVTILN